MQRQNINLSSDPGNEVGKISIFLFSAFQYSSAKKLSLCPLLLLCPFCLGKNACSVFLFILLFHVNSHFFSSFRSVFYVVYSRLTFHFSLSQLIFPISSHSSFGYQAIVMSVHSPLLAILQSTLQKTTRTELQ